MGQAAEDAQGERGVPLALRCPEGAASRLSGMRSIGARVERDMRSAAAIRGISRLFAAA